MTDVLKDQVLVHTNNVRSKLVTWAEKKAKSKVISPWDAFRDNHDVGGTVGQQTSFRCWFDAVRNR